MSLKSDFLTKSKQMRTWLPLECVSNRDRLELYSLHKQAANGDNDSPMPTASSTSSSSSSSSSSAVNTSLNTSLSTSTSPHHNSNSNSSRVVVTSPSRSNDLGKEKAKWNAWKTKSGLTQGEAMQRYITECDRQVRIYGSKGPAVIPSPSSARGSGSDEINQNPNPENTTRTHEEYGYGSSKIHTNESTSPGITAIPLLAAEASIPLDKYLTRMSVLTSSNSMNFWSLQKPVCSPPLAKAKANANLSEVGTYISLDNLVHTIERLVIGVGRTLESLPLSKGLAGSIHFFPFSFIGPSTITASIHSLHVALLTSYIAFILLISLLRTTILISQTCLLGSSSTKTTIPEILQYSLLPTSRLTSSLSNKSNPLPLRIFTSLLFYPLTITTDLTLHTLAAFGDLPSAAVFLMFMGCSAWYYAVVVPWLVLFPNFWVAGGVGMSRGFIEFVGGLE